MKIPKIIERNNRKYEFVSKVNENLFLYKDLRINKYETFQKFDIVKIDNTNIDKFLNIKNVETKKIIVYDRLFKEEIIYDSSYEAAKALETSNANLLKHLYNKKYLKNRWFIERAEWKTKD